MLVRASALKRGNLYVYTPIGPNNHLTGSRRRSPDRVRGHVAMRLWGRQRVRQKVSEFREARVGCVQAGSAASERTLESIESFLNLGADEVDIRTIQSELNVSKVRCLQGKERISTAVWEAGPTPVRVALL
jgi:hypothetical protein